MLGLCGFSSYLYLVPAHTIFPIENHRRPREGWDQLSVQWIPAFAGMTTGARFSGGPPATFRRSPETRSRLRLLHSAGPRLLGTHLPTCPSAYLPLFLTPRLLDCTEGRNPRQEPKTRENFLAYLTGRTKPPAQPRITTLAYAVPFVW